MISYPALFEQDREHPHLWSVQIPWLDGTEEGCYTCGTGLEEAHRMARDLVECWLILHTDAGREYPKPQPAEHFGEGWDLVQPSLRVWVALTLKRLRKQRGWSQVEAAKRLGITQPVYAKMEDPKKANPTLSTLERVERAFDIHLSLEVA